VEEFKIKEEYIQLNQLLKALGWAENGAQANAAIENKKVLVNDLIETRKRNKIRLGDKVSFNKQMIIIS
jgi:ribosome-associated protein